MMSFVTLTTPSVSFASRFAYHASMSFWRSPRAVVPQSGVERPSHPEVVRHERGGVVQDHNENVKPDKAKSTERIDLVSALVNALAVALPAVTGSVYDERPPLLVDL